MHNRRKFITKSLSAAVLPAVGLSSPGTTPGQEKEIYEKLDKAASQPVLNKAYFSAPVIIDKVELLHYSGNYICQVTSTDGAEGTSISNNLRMSYLYPIFLQRVAPFFIGKNALNLDTLVDEVYKYRSNYKFQSYALWVPVATVEFAILDMLGKISQKSIGELIGKIHNPAPGVYLATRFRNLSAEQSIDEAKKIMDNIGYRAVKFKIGEKMGNNAEQVAGRSEKLIALARKEFGTDTWLGVDTNGGYDVQEAIRIGKILQDYNYAFYEEPLPFDWYRATKEVADALEIPVAGGEQEASMRNFRWMIGDDVLQVLRPDMFYFGGMVRSMRVARMAQVRGLQIVPHLSGSGLGYLYAMHFLSAIPNGGSYNPCSISQTDEIVKNIASPTTSLQVENGKFKVPAAPGLGVKIAPDYYKKHKPVYS